MSLVSISMSDITHAESTKMVVSRASLRDQEKRSSSEPVQEMLCLSGGDSLTARDRKELIALFSATKAQLSRRSLSDRLTVSLMQSGLVCGITPTSTRERLGAATPDFVLLLPDGSRVEQRSQD